MSSYVSDSIQRHNGQLSELVLGERVAQGWNAFGFENFTRGNICNYFCSFEY